MTSQTVEERVEQRLQAMSEAEKKLEQLQKEKERVRMPDHDFKQLYSVFFSWSLLFRR